MYCCNTIPSNAANTSKRNFGSAFVPALTFSTSSEPTTLISTSSPDNALYQE
ncbi:MAG: hypothetical protein GX914_01055 [Erysipelotrichia bacterium]|nr:hypothetical protein [Erysipelotrichia bacterium]